ncbi:MAG: hypothetical protein IKB16_07175, partial [Lentisphaeria bacterium]|nr:hypothetical protein [Lentisphaeria bacterium]
SHRVDSVSLETDGIVVAMTYPENHCIGEYAIPYRNAISVNAGLGQYSSTFLSQGYASLHPGLSGSCRPYRTCFTANLRFIRILSFVSISFYNILWDICKNLNMFDFFSAGI